MLESMKWNAYAAVVIPTDPVPEQPIRPLQDVWLRPRRVFRELASQPIGRLDYLLGAAQGMVGWLAWSRTQNAGATDSVAGILGKGVVLGSLIGVASLYVMATIYARLGKRAGGSSTRNQVIHVLAYGSVPMAASLGIWVLTAVLAGEATFMQVPRPDLETFPALLLRAQFIAYVLLTIWSVVLQVMGLSEVQGLATRKAFGVWVLGQLIGLLAALFLTLVIATLLPNP
jgi:Yip1 domain